MSDTTASGRFIVRIQPELHDRLRTEAGARGVSLNELCTRLLQAPPGVGGAIAGVAAVVEHASRLLGADLEGVVLFGSWARGEAGPSSDVDVLIVVKSAVRRELYRLWEEAAPTIEGRVVEPSFVRLPDEDDAVSGLWAEVASDGLVVLDPALRVSRRLATVRRAIAAGDLVRRMTHGQPYWTEVS